MTKTAAISGLHIRLDVPTKCRIVETILTKNFSTSIEQNEYIEAIASKAFVNPVTIKLWCGKYQNTWKIGKKLPEGTMSFAFATVPEDKFVSAHTQLAYLRDRLVEVINRSQTKCYSILTKTDVTKTKTPSEVLDKLITIKKG